MSNNLPPDVIASTALRRSHADGECHPRSSLCHPREGGDPVKPRLDSRLRGNDNFFHTKTRLPQSLTLPRNDKTMHNKGVIASAAKQSHLNDEGSFHA